MHYSWNKNDLNAQTHGWSKILLESFKLTKRFLTSEPKLDKRSKRTRSHTPTTVGDILTFVLQTRCINSLIESPSPSNRRRFFSTLHSLLRFSCFVLINFLLGLPRHTQIDSVIWWRCLIWFAVINLPRAPRHSEVCVFVAALMRACARPDSGVHEINHFCQSLPLTLIKSMPLYRRQLRRRLWQRGVLSRTKCHGVHYLLQEARGEKCDAAPVSKKRSAVCGPLRSESVCEVDISLNPYQWHIFQAVTPWPCLCLFRFSLLQVSVAVDSDQISVMCDCASMASVSGRRRFWTYLKWGIQEHAGTWIATWEEREKNSQMRMSAIWTHYCTLLNTLQHCHWL